ncbi:hypothetical protein [Bacillus phage vB_BtM_BMBsp2]|nr:hypothetical protein [Bacillus phage vB_BtM_BMBsp2]
MSTEYVSLCRRHADETWILHMNYMADGGKKGIRLVDKEKCRICERRRERERNEQMGNNPVT